MSRVVKTTSMAHRLVTRSDDGYFVEPPHSEETTAMNPSATSDKPLVLGKHVLHSRLIVGTGKYTTFELMQQCLEASGSEVITVAVRRAAK